MLKKSMILVSALALSLLMLVLDLHTATSNEDVESLDALDEILQGYRDRLEDAISARDVVLVRDYLNETTTMERKALLEERYQPLLFLAATHNHLQIASLLIEHGASATMIVYGSELTILEHVRIHSHLIRPERDYAAMIRLLKGHGATERFLYRNTCCCVQ